jgi:large subunit ribosomal protein L2
MLLKNFKALTPSLRQRIQINYSAIISINKRLKKLTKGKKSKGGRNAFGRLTSFKKGGGHKKSYRFLSSHDIKKKLPFFFIGSIEYDPFRSSFISCCFLKESGFFQYIITAQNTKKGSLLNSNYYFNVPYESSPCYLKFIKTGDFVYNLNLKNSKNHQVAKAAGTFCKIMKQEVNSYFSKVILPSGALYKISFSSLSFIGKSSNNFKRFTNLSKAGRKRWLGIKPTVRGVAMNPVDHPHGGGEGKSSGGRPSSTPWGFPTKGKPTKKKKVNNYFIRKLIK